MAQCCLKVIFAKYLLDRSVVTELEQYPFLDAPHSDVYEGKLDNKPVALKRWRVSRASNEQTETTLKTLVKKLDEWRSTSSHPNILSFLGLCEGNGRVPVLILPRLRYNIARFVGENSRVDKLALAYQLAEALSYIHSQDPPIVHGSIKDTNVLISCDHKVMVTDIGIYATFLNPEMSQDWRPSDRPRFQPPEQLMRSDVDAMQPSTDVWSFAMVVLQMYTGSLPYGHLLNPNTAILHIAQGHLPPQPDETLVSSDLWHEFCLTLDPSSAGETRSTKKITLDVRAVSHCKGCSNIAILWFWITVSLRS
ncbi:hypothetical protein NP233_g2554 [Leucocoprinus birnbaumii]|uniref:Protein kinase domain-containing protein n=1 Tax=Leucocoprinus birnbaumii TaxID=56174 RepID=A0AAD5YX75_9AGAR|nr:hypothetical protein NP233_g2554 [Leucocoprinus birnbaumii]